eukprot:jgi/Picre1/27591/NNA_000556.t1
MEREQDPEKGAVVHFDVEAVLERIRLDLDVGELFASPAFDLTNAMTAMEIGDPKMDPGMHRYDQKTLSERIAGGEAPVHFDNTVDVLAIMDRLLQLEIGWHDHYMLSQTVYTCLYMMDMERISSHRILYAYCRSVHVTCSYLYELIYRAQVCYDEDASVVTFGIHLDKVTVDDMRDVIKNLDDAIDQYKEDKDDSMREIVSRLEFRKCLLHILSGMEDAVTVDALHDVIGICNRAKHILATQKYCSDEEANQSIGFAPTLHFAAIGPAPMRKLVLRSVREASEQWMSVLEALSKTCHWISGVQTWKDLRSCLDTFAGCDYGAFVRSMTYNALVPSVPKARAPWRPDHAMLIEDICLRVPDETFYKNISSVGEIEMFFDQCAIAVRGWCHTKCLNKCRQHRRLKHNIQDWKNMIDHAYTAENSTDGAQWIKDQGFRWDTQYDPSMEVNAARVAPLTCWVVQEACWTCIDYLLKGGPLDLYQSEEMTSIYCLRLPAQHKHIKGVDLAQLQAEPPKGPLRDSWMRRRLCAFYGLVFGSISRISLALKHCGLIPEMKHPFNTRGEQYVQRFESMSTLVIPEYLRYEHFVEYEYNLLGIPMDAGNVEEEPVPLPEMGLALLQQALTQINTCSSFLSSFKELMPKDLYESVHRTIAANSTALTLLHRLAKRDAASVKTLASQFTASWTQAPSSKPQEPYSFSSAVLLIPTLTITRRTTTST